MDERKIALVISSYKRPDLLMRQLFCMFHQTYLNFKAFVSVKGVAEYFLLKIYQGYFRQYVEEDRLVLKFNPNKNQVSNFLDPLRGEQTGEFDLFCKIDDDDFYGPEYLAHVNRIVGREGGEPNAFMWGGSFAMLLPGKLDGMVKFPGGSGCVVTPEIIGDLFVYEAMEVEGREARWKELNPGLEPRKSGDRYGGEEDTLIHDLARMYGCCQLWKKMSLDARSRLFIPRRNGDSVTRGGESYLGKAFREVNRIVTTDPANWEYTVCLRRKSNHESFHLFQNTVYGVDGEQVGKTTHFDFRSALAIQWDGGNEESFEYVGKDVYRII